jgi:neutral ceramidase
MLRAGAASLDITPPLGLRIQAATHQNDATSVRDPLEANALYLSGDEEGVLLLGCDLAAIEPEQTARVRERVAAACGIPSRSVIISATHTHGGPVMMPSNRYNGPDPAYQASLEAKLEEVASRAARSARPARLAWGQGTAVLGYNRRTCFADGTHAMHGDTGRADFTGLEGPVDNRHLALFAKDEGSGELIGVAYNNASHPTTFYGGRCFSSDFPGAARAMLRQALGPSLPVLFLNGAQGDICMENREAPEPSSEKPEQKIMRLAAIAAGETLRLLYVSPFVQPRELRHAWSDLPVRVRLPSPDRLVAARRLLERADRGEGALDPWEVLFAHGIDLLDRRFGEDPVDRLPVHVVRIDDLALVTLPGEFYCQFGLDIRRRSPAAATGIVGIADGNHGYCPTMAGIIGGGYSGEPILWTRLAEDAGYRVVDEACRLLRTLWPRG